MKKAIFIYSVIAVFAISAAFATGNDNSAVKLPETITYDGGYYAKLEYDSQNRITKISWYNEDGTTSSMDTFTYRGEDLVKVGDSDFSKNGNKITSDFFVADLNNEGYISNLLMKGIWDHQTVQYSYQYQGGNIKKWTKKFTETWEGKTIEGTSLEYECTYDNYKSPFVHCKTPKWFMDYLFPKLNGQNNNVDEDYWWIDKGARNYSGKIKYVYMYDNDGYPTKRTIKLFDSKGNEYEPEEALDEAMIIDFKYVIAANNAQQTNNGGNASATTTNDETNNTTPERQTTKTGEISFNFEGYNDLANEEHGKILMNVILRETIIEKKIDRNGKSYDNKSYKDLVVGSGTLKEGFTVKINDPKSDQHEVIIKVKEDRILAGLAGIITGSTKVGDAIVSDLKIELKRVMSKNDFKISAKKNINNKGVTTYSFIVN